MNSQISQKITFASLYFNISSLHFRERVKAILLMSEWCLYDVGVQHVSDIDVLIWCFAGTVMCKTVCPAGWL